LPGLKLAKDLFPSVRRAADGLILDAFKVEFPFFADGIVAIGAILGNEGSKGIAESGRFTLSSNGSQGRDAQEQQKKKPRLCRRLVHVYLSIAVLPAEGSPEKQERQRKLPAYRLCCVQTNAHFSSHHDSAYYARTSTPNNWLEPHGQGCKTNGEYLPNGS
jgi:hypothetical protein